MMSNVLSTSTADQFSVLLYLNIVTKPSNKEVVQKLFIIA